MKLAFRDIELFIKNPNPKARVILIYGPDAGLVKERAGLIGKKITPDLNDPFAVTTLTTESISEDPARLIDEAGAISMMGGGKLLRITEGTDKITPTLKEYLKNPDNRNLVVIEAGELGPKSSLRILCEKDRSTVTLPCYIEEGADLERFIRSFITEQGFRIEPDALFWLAENLMGDRARVRAELEKLVLYMGKDKTINIESTEQACGQAGQQSMDHLVNCVAGLSSKEAMKYYDQLLQDGVPIISILRALQYHFRRLHITKARIETGERKDTAIDMLMPKIFFKQKNTFQMQLDRWPLKKLTMVLDRLASLEEMSKKTNTPVETLCGQALLAISSSRK